MSSFDQETPIEKQRDWRVTGIIFFALIALALLYLFALILWPFINAIILGAVLVTLTFSLYQRLRARFKGSASKAATVMLLGITFIILIPAVILGAMLVQQANGVIENMQSGDAQQMLARIDISHRLGWVKRYVPGFDPQSVSLQRAVLPAVKQLPGWVARNGGTLLGGIAGLVLGFFLVLLSAFFFYVEGDAILEQLSILSPLPRRYDREFRVRFKDVIDATFRGQVMTALAQGLATGIGLAIAGVPGAFFWGATAVILSLLPMVGAAAVWVPATVYLFISASMGQRGMWSPIFLLIWGVAVVSLVDNIVRPWAMKGKAQMPAIPLLFAVLGGMQAFGIVGLVIGPLVFSLLMTIIDIYKRSFGAVDTNDSTIA